MKRLYRNSLLELLIVMTIAFVILPGCTPQQIKGNVEAAVMRDIVVPIAVPDFEAASQAAHDAGDEKGAACWDKSLAYLKALPTTSSAGDPFAQLKNIKGIASAIELERIQQTTPQVAIPPIPDDVTMACSLVTKDLKLFLLQLSATAAKTVAVGGFFKASATLGAEAAALKAAGAAAKP